MLKYKNGQYCNADSIKTSYYESGQIMVETPIINGMKEGLEQTYFKNGRLQKTIWFENDRPNGQLLMYYNNKASVIHYIRYYINGSNPTPDIYFTETGMPIID